MPAGNVFKPRRSLTRQTNPIQRNQGPVQPLFANDNHSGGDLEEYVRYAESYGQTPRLIFGRSPGPGESGYLIPRQTNPIQRNAVAMSTDDTRGQGQVRLDRAPQLYANPMRNAMNYYPGHPDYVAPGPPTFQEQYRTDRGMNPGNANYIYGVDDVDENGNPFPKGYNGMQLLGNNGPQSFNPQNQDVLARAAAALRAIEQDRLSPMGTVSNPEAGAVPQSVLSQSNTGTAPYPMNPGRSAPAPGMFSQLMGGVRGLMQQGVNAFNQAYPDQARRDMAQAQSMIGASQNIDGMVSRSRRDNPMAPPGDASMDAMNASDEVFNRFQRFQQAAPIPRDSFGAARNSRQAYDQTTAGFSNGYNGMLNNPMMSPEEKLQFAEQNARRVAGGGAAVDPTNMRGRFGGTYGMGLNADAADIQNGRAARLADGSVVRFTGTPESARQAQLAGKTEREWLRNHDNENVPKKELERRAKAEAQQAARSARAREFEAANNGMNYRQMDRLNRQNALTEKAVREGRLSPESANLRMQNRADTALRRSGNPMLAGTDESRTLFPNMVQGRGGNVPSAAPNPMIQAFEPGAPNTPENNAIRNEMKAKLDETSPTLQAMGVAPDMGPAELADAVTSYQGDISDDGLIELHNRVKTFAGDNQGKSPFEGSNGPTDVGMFAELWALPIGTPPSKIREWLQRYRAEAQRRSQFRDSGPMGTGQVPPTGGPPPSQPLYIPTNPIRTGA